VTDDSIGSYIFPAATATKRISTARLTLTSDEVLVLIGAAFVADGVGLVLAFGGSFGSGGISAVGDAMKVFSATPFVDMGDSLRVQNCSAAAGHAIVPRSPLIVVPEGHGFHSSKMETSTCPLLHRVLKHTGRGVESVSIKHLLVGP
jgi:hypothetical protein